MARFTRTRRNGHEFFNLFDEAGANILRAAELLDRLLREWPDQAGLEREILICEQEGDRITHDVIQLLNHKISAPMDREDVYALASALDDIVDYTEEAADFLHLYHIEAPMDQAQQLSAVLRDACRSLSLASRACTSSATSTTNWSRSTASRTRATGSPVKRSLRCSPTGSTRWS